MNQYPATTTNAPPSMIEEGNLPARLYPTNEQSDDDEIKLRELWYVLLRHKGLIVTTTLFVFIVSLVTTLMIKPTYKATAIVQINPENAGRLLNYSVSAERKYSYYDETYYKTQYSLLKSRALARRVMDKLGVDENKGEVQLAKPFFSETIDNLKEWLGLEEIKIWVKEELLGRAKDRKLGLVPPEDWFLGGLSIDTGKGNSRIVRLNYVSESPENAADIVNTFAEEYINMNLESRVDAASYAEDFLKEQLILAKSKLEESEQLLVSYSKKKGILKNNENQSFTSISLTQLSGALAQAEQERIEAESNYKQTKISSEDSQVQGSSVIQSLKTTRAKLQGEYQEKLGLYKPGYPGMQQLQKRIRDLSRQIKREMSSTKKAARGYLESKYKAAKAKESELRSKYNATEKEFIALRDNSIEYNTLNREVQTNRQIYNDLLQRMKEVGVAGSIGTNNITIVDRAVIPYRKYKPDIKLNLLLGLTLGLVLGVGGAFLIEALEDNFKSVEEIEHTLHSVTLGMVPSVKEQRGIKYTAQIAMNDPRSAVAEAYRSLRSNLMFSTSEGVPKSIVVTSAIPSEGKSTSVINLATALCQIGKTVLIIDADLRKPSLYKRLDLSNSEGLANYLAGQSSAEKITKSTNIDELYVIPAGPAVPNPVELLSSDKMDDLITDSSELFDYIIVDSPPVMGIADALILSNKVSATLFVSAYAGAKKTQIVTAINRLRQAQANIIGVLFTKVKTATGSDYHYDYYYYNDDNNHYNKKLL